MPFSKAPPVKKTAAAKPKPVAKIPIKKSVMKSKPVSKPIRKKLTKLEKDALKEIGSIGAGKAATALSAMLGQTVEAKVPLADAIPLTNIPKVLKGREKIVTAIYQPVKGSVKGSVLIFFPQKSALLLTDLMMKKKKGTTKTLKQLDESALKEIGNILSGNCLTALSNFLNMNMLGDPPHLATDMVGAIVDSIVVKLSQKSEQALIIEMEFKTKEAKIPAYFFLLFDSRGAEAVLKTVREKVRTSKKGANVKSKGVKKKVGKVKDGK